MSVGTPPGGPPDPNQVENARRQINQMAEEIAQLSEAELSPADYYREFTDRLMFAGQAGAAAVWLRTPQGNLVLQYQVNLREVGLERYPESRPLHDGLLRQTVTEGNSGIAPPNSSRGGEGEQAVGNPTDMVILLAPILYDKAVVGLVELFIDPQRPAQAQKGLLQFMLRMASLAGNFTRNHELRQMSGKQQVWLQLEDFSRKVHASLNPTEVAYHISNEGRRLVEADRINVAVRTGRKAEVLAISGADVVEKRSNLVVLMRTLFDKVLDWGEKLVYTGTKDESLPPDVLHALDGYLAESNSKILVVMPVKDEREEEKKKKPRSALMMESFETSLAPEQLLARLDVVGKHAGSALYNASEYRRIPMRFLWMPLAYVQDGMGGKAQAITAAVVTAVTVLLLAMFFVPYPLRIEAKAQLLPKQRAYIYSPVPGSVVEIRPNLTAGTKVYKGQELVTMFDIELAKQVRDLQREIASADAILQSPVLRGTQGQSGENPEQAARMDEAKITRQAKLRELENLRHRTNANLNNPGAFVLKSPMTGIILSSDFRETLIGKYVRPNEPLLRVGYNDTAHPKLSDWELELKIPQKHVGQVLRAFERLKPGAELDVDLLILLEPTSVYTGKLSRDKVAAQANANKDDHNEPEPIVMAWARVSGDDIPESARIPTTLLLAGTEVHTRIRCGNRAMGYSLFYGVWEFLFEKVVFFF